MEYGLSTSLPLNSTVSLFTGAPPYQFPVWPPRSIPHRTNKVFCIHSFLTQVTTLFPFFWPLIASIHTGFVDCIKGPHSFLLKTANWNLWKIKQLPCSNKYVIPWFLEILTSNEVFPFNRSFVILARPSGWEWRWKPLSALTRNLIPPKPPCRLCSPPTMTLQ